MDKTVEFINERLGVTYTGDTKHLPLDSPTATRETVAQILGELHLNVGAEIGVEQGLFSETLCKANPDHRLYCIDAWKAYRGYRDHVSQSKMDGFFEAATARLKSYNATIIRKFSMEAVGDFPVGSLDYVYIDGNHGFDWVMEDIINWSRRVRRGGIVAGHDFIRRLKEPVHVIQATQSYTYCHGIAPWWCVGGSTKETRSFLWVKP